MHLRDSNEMVDLDEELRLTCDECGTRPLRQKLVQFKQSINVYCKVCVERSLELIMAPEIKKPEKLLTFTQALLVVFSGGIVKVNDYWEVGSSLYMKGDKIIYEFVNKYGRLSHKSYFEDELYETQEFHKSKEWIIAKDPPKPKMPEQLKIFKKYIDKLGYDYKIVSQLQLLLDLYEDTEID